MKPLELSDEQVAELREELIGEGSELACPWVSKNRKRCALKKGCSACGAVLLFAAFDFEQTRVGELQAQIIGSHQNRCWAEWEDGVLALFEDVTACDLCAEYIPALQARRDKEK